MLLGKLPAYQSLPEPPLKPVIGHLEEWALRPLPLLEGGAQQARATGRDIFRLRLGLPAVVGFSPAWNRALLTELDTFVSAGSFSRVVPHLAGGIILTDAPAHAGRRQTLNPGFGKTQLQALRQLTASALGGVPETEFDALAWADQTVMTLLNAAYFSGEFNTGLLRRFLAPLRQPFPVPALPRPRLFGQVDQELRRLANSRRGRGHDLLAFLAPLPGGLSETRVSLAAAHDTTTHALAYALWFLAKYPQWHAPEHHPAVLSEVLRLYPPGWVGSRRLKREFVWQSVTLPRGALALYSPYLCGRDPKLWNAPDEFRPQRWQNKPPAWAYLPFGGGERTCLGMHLAKMLILDALAQLPPLQALEGDPQPQPGVTLGPKGPLWLKRR